MRKSRQFCADAVAKAALALALLAGSPAIAATLPAIFPTPASVRMTGADFALGPSVVLVRPEGTDHATETLVRDALAAAGVVQIRAASVVPKHLDTVYVLLGMVEAAPVREALARTGATLPERKEGYALGSVAGGEGAVIVLAGKDNDGLYHAAQTFRQIIARGRVASVAVSDYPAMPVRGTIEGFYGKPWTMAERAAHIAFLARFKANTYIYSPKDDVFARDRWRDPYPSATLDALGKVVAVANREHINFVYAISPGPSVCYSDPADLDAIRHKFAALRGRGVRSFYVAFDDIEYTKWNCKDDEAAFGPAGESAAAAAQAKLLNAVQADIAAAGHGSLIMVPTEYFNVTESPYKAKLRQALDPRVVVQWTGTDVVPSSISIMDAKSATKAFGRMTLLWDNYPVNDFAETTGRLLMAPYDRRQAGLSEELSGIVANPMNQEVSSRPAVAGLLAFAWNDRDYDAQRTWRAAARDLAGGDPVVTQALLAFFDTQHMAPTFGHLPWQPQAPRLKSLIDDVRDALADGDPAASEAALDALGKAADALAAAPERIRAGASTQGFVAEAAPWLDATQLWGRSLRFSADGLTAALAGDRAALRDFEEAKRLAAKASAIQSIPGATRFAGPVKVADGVLDTFVADAPLLVYLPRVQE
ncbi:beta-N-acetylglucosaminidase domain-containing protein [Xanthomonas sp. NCPPB 2654]|uniref:beta-N-acetylhexosaminidase family protein n=1 Tax=unclassified Xanthomonas TaxID=2643310 RepID=UPI0021E0D6B8|nr:MULTISPECIES: beta-N-acetylglucosaminidase domain-containing protein [unclassified Xanthomonas]MDL5365583.1 beta-N-acetylglucosaminidase domain-containing protein [Xanthomonas sp. NCPPB 2654]UYC18796.1 beta-N-acetylglucosaminidase domain-containing protein [Xanthomonas sp. CFBP 8443]